MCLEMSSRSNESMNIKSPEMGSTGLNGDQQKLLHFHKNLFVSPLFRNSFIASNIARQMLAFSTTQRNCLVPSSCFLSNLQLFGQNACSETGSTNGKGQSKLGKTRRQQSSFIRNLLVPVAFCDSGKRIWNEYAEENLDSLPGVQVKRKVKGLDQSGTDTVISPMEINHWIESETGMDRLRDAYTFGSDGKFVNEDTRNLTTMLYRTVLVGFFVNVFSASQKHDKKEKFLSRTEAAAKGALNKKVIPYKIFKEAMRVTLRMSLSALTVFHLPHIIATYRNETTMWEFVLAASLACGIMGRGLRGFLTMSATGSVFGIVGGYFIPGFLMQHGLSQEQRHLERVKELILEKRNSDGAKTKTEVL